MAVGQDVCLPNGRPKCEDCPLSHLCRAHGAGRETDYPNKPPKKARRKEKLTVLLLRHGERYALSLRPDGGLLAGLWQFPNVAGRLNAAGAVEAVQGLGFRPAQVLRQSDKKHIFTHIQWNMRGFYMETADICDGFVWMTADEIEEKAALPTAFRQFWEDRNV